MADHTGESLSTDAVKNFARAAELAGTIALMVSKINEVDSTIKRLVQSGIEGTAVEEAANSYLKNRKALSEYLQAFASVQAVVEQTTENRKGINEKAQAAGTIHS